MSAESLLSVLNKNYKQNPEKIICSDQENNLTWQDLISVANEYAKEFRKVKQNTIPILISRSIDTPCAIIGCIIAGKIFPISEDQPITRIENIFNQLDIEYFLNLGKKQISNIK